MTCIFLLFIVRTVETKRVSQDLQPIIWNLNQNQSFNFQTVECLFHHQDPSENAFFESLAPKWWPDLPTDQKHTLHVTELGGKSNYFPNLSASWLV